MPRNRKLTKIIAGRTVKVTTLETGGVLVLFDDWITHDDQDSRTCNDTARRKSKIHT